MNFRSGSREEPEINLIPFIDVLLVVLIFLMLSTTYSKFTELQVRLPSADAEAPRQLPHEIIVAIASDGRYSIAGQLLQSPSVDTIAEVLQKAANGRADTVVVISADAAATHQSVIHVMDAARRSQLPQITFATQSAGGAAQR